MLKKLIINEALQVGIDTKQNVHLVNPFRIKFITKDNLEFYVYIALDDIKKYLTQLKIDAQIKSLQDTRNYLKEQIALCLKWLDASVLSSIICSEVELYHGSLTSGVRVNFYLHKFLAFKFGVYLDQEDEYAFTELCQNADNQYVQENYLLFNHKFYFPIIVGKSMLTSFEVERMAVGDVIIFDEKSNINELTVNWSANNSVNLTL